MLKYSVKGKPGGSLVMARGCSPVRSLSMRSVTYVVQLIARFTGEVFPFMMVTLCRGPLMILVADR